MTGHDAAGKSVFVSDAAVEAITLKLMPGAEHYNIWGADSPPTFPDDGSMPAHFTHFPPLNGFRFGLVTIPPQSASVQATVDLKADLAELENKLPGLAAHLDPARPGMHQSDTIDFEYIISGEIWLELDSGRELRLQPGDTVVQNGTRHAWRNKGPVPCQMAVCLIGARRRPD